MAQLGSVPSWGDGGRGFRSRCSEREWGNSHMRYRTENIFQFWLTMERIGAARFQTIKRDTWLAQYFPIFFIGWFDHLERNYVSDP